MTQKTPEKRVARALQKRTGWSYMECLRCVRELSVREIDALVAVRSGGPMMLQVPSMEPVGDTGVEVVFRRKR